MSSYSLINQPLYGRKYVLTNLAGARPVTACAATALEELALTKVASGASDLYITLPAGKYTAQMESCLTTTVDGTPVIIRYAQLQLIGINSAGNNQLLGVGQSYSKTMDGTFVNILNNNLYLSDTVFLDLTETTQLTLRLAYNINVVCATKSGNIALNPILPCENKVTFYSVL